MRIVKKPEIKESRRIVLPLQRTCAEELSFNIGLEVSFQSPPPETQCVRRSKDSFGHFDFEFGYILKFGPLVERNKV